MAAISLKLDTRHKNKIGKFPLCLQVSKQGDSRFIKLGILLTEKQWDGKKIKGIDNAPRQTNKYNYRLSLANKFLTEHELDVRVMDINSLKRTLEVEIKKKQTTSDRAIDLASVDRSDKGYLSVWGQVLRERALAASNKGTANWYRDGIHAFVRFNKGRDVLISDITVSFLEDFIAYGYKEIRDTESGEIIKKSYKPNSISSFMRSVRAIMNQAIKENKPFISQSHAPFKKVTIPSEIVEVDSISKTEIKALRSLSLTRESDLWKARARFLFLFSSQGMNFTDLARLKINNRSGDTFSYYRAKTSRQKKRKSIEVSMTKKSKEIWKFFAKGKSEIDYVFDILPNESQTKKFEHAAHLQKYNKRRQSTNPAVTEKNRISRGLKNQNELLGELSSLIGCHKKITTYDARYSWVNAALDSGVSEELIGKGLGHQNLVVTRRYFEEKHKRSSLGELNELITQ